MTNPTIAENVERVQARIAEACARVGRDPASITLVAVSKTKSTAQVLAALEAGVRHFGENRVEEAQTKIPDVRGQYVQSTGMQPVWHMIGHIQSRKARDAAGLFNVIHSVDSVKLAQKIAQSHQKADPLDVFVQVNVSGEESKSGLDAVRWQVDSASRERLVQEMAEIAALPGLRLRGLMTMAPIVADMEQARPVFAAMAALREMLSSALKQPLPDLSMGMTDDYPVAIEEGATVVRVGRAIFGERD
ncbi:MAG: YggS family pyridoxal phosphate-dependent enzyme [Anaerolineae bacterium]